MVAPVVSAQQLVPATNGRAIQIGLRVGYGVPFGKTGRTATDVGGDDSLSRAIIKGQIPIGLDVGYRITSNVDVSLLLQYGFGRVGSGNDGVCDAPGNSCSTSDLILGLGVHLHMNPSASFDPWIGFGFGYEWLNFSGTFSAIPSLNFPGQSLSVTRSGFEYVDVQVGGDVRVSPSVSVGPFVSFATGQYLSVSQGSTSQDIIDNTFHEWLLFGVRGVYDVRL
jgi:outer membrane protein W